MIKGISTSAAAVAASVLIVACGSAGDSSTSGANSGSSSQEAATPLAEAVQGCGLAGDPGFDLGDEGYTLSMDGKGKDDRTGASIDDIACVLKALDVSDAVVSRIDNTRALDGTLEGAWEGFTATWSYHPDSGISMVIEADQER